MPAILPQDSQNFAQKIENDEPSLDLLSHEIDFLAEEVEKTDDEDLDGFLNDYRLQASLCYNIFVQEFTMYMPRKLDDDIVDLQEIHGIFDDFFVLLDVTETRRPEDEAAMAYSIIKRCNPIIRETELAMRKHETWKLKDEFNKVLCLACAIKVFISIFLKFFMDCFFLGKDFIAEIG